MHVHAFAFCRPDRVQSVTYSAVLELMLTKECWRLCRAELLTVEPENHPDLDSSRSSCIGIASSTNRFGSGKKSTSRLYLCSVHLSMATVCSSVGHVGAACGPNPTRQRKKTRGIKHRDRVPADHRPDSSPKPVGVRLPRHGAAPTPAASALHLAHCSWRVVCVPDERTDNKQVVEQKLLSLTSFPILLLIFFSFLLKLISLSVTLCN
jgi:hypothetical protein